MVIRTNHACFIRQRRTLLTLTLTIIVHHNIIIQISKLTMPLRQIFTAKNQEREFNQPIIFQ